MFDIVINSQSELIAECAKQLSALYDKVKSDISLSRVANTMLKPIPGYVTAYSLCYKEITQRRIYPHIISFIDTKNYVFKMLVADLELSEFRYNAGTNKDECNYVIWDGIVIKMLEDINRVPV